MQNINVFDMKLTDHSLRESLWIIDSFLKNGALNTILFTSAKMLVGAGNSEVQKEWMEAIDLIVWSDAQVLAQIGVTSKTRIHEIENMDFLKEFLKKVSRNKYSVYLLAESQSHLDILRDDLRRMKNDLHFVGESVITPETSSEALLNQINSCAPKVIISRFPFEEQERQMNEMRRYLNAEVWMALNYQMILDGTHLSTWKKLLNKWYRFVFHKQIQSYSETPHH